MIIQSTLFTLSRKLKEILTLDSDATDGAIGGVIVASHCHCVGEWWHAGEIEALQYLYMYLGPLLLIFTRRLISVALNIRVNHLTERVPP